MSDRNSAEIFRFLFVELAELVELENRHSVEVAKVPLLGIAKKAWKEMHKYDFAYYQLDCDDKLATLDLARHTEGGVEYRTRDCKGWA